MASLDIGSEALVLKIRRLEREQIQKDFMVYRLLHFSCSMYIVCCIFLVQCILSCDQLPTFGRCQLAAFEALLTKLKNENERYQKFFLSVVKLKT